MKTRILIALIAALVFGLRAEAQICVLQISSGKQIILGEPLSTSQVTTRLGPIQKTYSQEDESVGGYLTVYEYKGFVFSTVDSKVYDFDIKTNAYSVTINKKYQVKIGDNLLSFIRLMPANEVIIKVSGRRTDVRFEVINPNIISDDALILESNSQGVIIRIWWHSPV